MNARDPRRDHPAGSGRRRHLTLVRDTRRVERVETSTAAANAAAQAALARLRNFH